MPTPRLAHVVFQTGRPTEMRDWYCALLEGEVVFEDEVLTFIGYDDEHHRVALIAPPGMEHDRKTETTAAMHHMAFTFDDLDDLLARYESLRDQGIVPAVCVAHGITTSLYYKDPDGNFVELQIDRFAEPEQATAYMLGPDYAEDSVGPAFDPEAMLQARRAGASAEELSDRAWAKRAGLPPAIATLLGPR